MREGSEFPLFMKWRWLGLMVRASGGGESRCRVCYNLDLGLGSKEPVSLRGSLAWQRVSLPGSRYRLGGSDSPFSLHFRSPMSSPSTSTPQTPSARVSFRPPASALVSLGGIQLSVFRTSPHHTCSGWQTGKKLQFAVRWPGIQGQLCLFQAV